MRQSKNFDHTHTHNVSSVTSCTLEQSSIYTNIHPIFVETNMECELQMKRGFALGIRFGLFANATLHLLYYQQRLKLGQCTVLLALCFLYSILSDLSLSTDGQQSRTSEQKMSRMTKHALYPLGLSHCPCSL